MRKRRGSKAFFERLAGNLASRAQLIKGGYKHCVYTMRYNLTFRSKVSRPAGDYSAVVCGALTLIFGAAARMSEVRKKILDALDCIPDALEIPEALLNVYRTDQVLARKAAELYMALLEAIEGMLDWLDHKAYSKPHLCLTQGWSRG